MKIYSNYFHFAFPMCLNPFDVSLLLPISNYFSFGQFPLQICSIPKSSIEQSHNFSFSSLGSLHIESYSAQRRSIKHEPS